MQNEQLIAVSDFCRSHELKPSFIETLQHYGLVELMRVDSAYFIPDRDLQKLEKFTRLYYELDINVEGIEALLHLLEKVEEMQQEITRLKNKLHQYQAGEQMPAIEF